MMTATLRFVSKLGPQPCDHGALLAACRGIAGRMMPQADFSHPAKVLFLADATDFSVKVPFVPTVFPAPCNDCILSIQPNEGDTWEHMPSAVGAETHNFQYCTSAIPSCVLLGSSTFAL